MFRPLSPDSIKAVKTAKALDGRATSISGITAKDTQQQARPLFGLANTISTFKDVSGFGELCPDPTDFGGRGLFGKRTPSPAPSFGGEGLFGQHVRSPQPNGFCGGSSFGKPKPSPKPAFGGEGLFGNDRPPSSIGFRSIREKASSTTGTSADADADVATPAPSNFSSGKGSTATLPAQSTHQASGFGGGTLFSGGTRFFCPLHSVPEKTTESEARIVVDESIE